MMELVKGDLKVMWSDIGEGWDGDYNPDNPDDVELLRFDVMELAEDGVWESVDNGSYCTAMPVGSSEKMLKTGLELILEAVECNRETGVKRVLEELSWMNPSWFD